VQKKSCTTPKAWRRACIFSNYKDWNEDEYQEYFKAMAYALTERRPTCTKLEATELGGLYHTCGLPTGAADCLRDAGFHKIDSHRLVGCVQRSNHCHYHLQGTPLWIHSILALIEDKIPLLEWLVKKDARLDWKHPQYGTTPRNLAR
jgi:hypothetical protein